MEPEILFIESLYLFVVSTIGTVLSDAISSTSAVATILSASSASTTDLGAFTVTTGIVSLSSRTMMTFPSDSRISV